MTKSHKYLSVLSKVMEEDQQRDSFDRTSYNKLYSIIHSELYEQLKVSLYPEAPVLTKKIDCMLDDMEALFLCNELIGKACLSVSGYHTNKLFPCIFGMSRQPQLLQSLSKMFTQIPFVVVHGDIDTIEVLNYANRRVPISQAEYRLLISESGKNRVALHRIVKFFLIHTPLKRENICFIFDNVYKSAYQIFRRVISRRIFYADHENLNNIRRKPYLPNSDAILCNVDRIEDLPENMGLRGKILVKPDTLEDYLSQYVSPILYGFRDEFRSLAARIRIFYADATQHADETAQKIVSDMVRLGTGADQTLSAIRKSAQSQSVAFRAEYRNLSDILSRTDACVLEVENILNDTIAPGKRVPRRVYDDIFGGFFAAGENCLADGQELLDRLTTLGYDGCDLVAAYLQAVTGQTPQIVWEPVEKGQWEKAKMLIEISDLDSLPLELIRGYVTAITQSRLETGKELYAKSLVAEERNKTQLLKKSFERGYAPAGTALLKRYQAGDKMVNLQTLTNAMVPEACMMMAERQKSAETSQRGYANVSSVQFTYYKIAAARGNLPAIAKIVDTVFQSRFSTAFQLHGDQLNDSKFREMVENGHAICQLCRYLIDRMYQVKHFREILGVVLFCLNENLSEAMTQLSGIDTGIAHYCKGNLYEFGNGVSRDIDQAVSHYQQAYDQGFRPPQLERRLEISQKKRYQKTEKSSSAHQYQKERSYQPTKSNESSSSSMCVITTAACKALNKSDDCEELNLLRRFRDTQVESSTEGEAAVLEYYRIGPLVTAAIEKDPNWLDIYRQLWVNEIVPSCEAIRHQKFRRAKSIYVQMVLRLCRKYEIVVSPQISAIVENPASEFFSTGGDNSAI